MSNLHMKTDVKILNKTLNITCILVKYNKIKYIVFKQGLIQKCNGGLPLGKSAVNQIQAHQCMKGKSHKTEHKRTFIIYQKHISEITEIKNFRCHLKNKKNKKHPTTWACAESPGKCNQTRE